MTHIVKLIKTYIYTELMVSTHNDPLQHPLQKPAAASHPSHLSKSNLMIIQTYFFKALDIKNGIINIHIKFQTFSKQGLCHTVLLLCS